MIWNRVGSAGTVLCKQTSDKHTLPLYWRGLEVSFHSLLSSQKKWLTQVFLLSNKMTENLSLSILMGKETKLFKFGRKDYM